MWLEVPKADVVLVNPTHYAVALKWSRAKGSAPICVAKGEGEVALKIRSVAETAAIPVRLRHMFHIFLFLLLIF